MANYENSKDLKKVVLGFAGELDDGTSEYDDKVMTYLNRAHHALLSGAADLGMDVGQPWSWAKRPYPSVIILQPAIRSQLISATFNSATISFFVAPVGISYQGYYITFGDDRTAYRIKGHTAGALTATLDSVYLGSTIVNASTRLMKYDYQLDPQVLRLIGPFSTARSTSFDWDGKVEMIDQTSFARDYPMTIREGCPDRLTEIHKSNEMRPTVRFNRIPAFDSQPLRIEYDYIPVPDDLTDDENSIPLVPRDHRVTLCYYAAYYLLMDKNDNRAAEYRELARAGIMAMVRALKVQKANTNENYGRFISRSGQGYCRFWTRGGYDS